MQFEIDPDFVKSITIREEHHRAVDPNNPTTEELVSIIKYGPFWATSIKNEDHPEFAKLRDQLEKTGYIKTERKWLNGDRVLKKFYLNGVLFKKGDQFSCASAMSWYLQLNKRNK